MRAVSNISVIIQNVIMYICSPTNIYLFWFWSCSWKNSTTKIFLRKNISDASLGTHYQYKLTLVIANINLGKCFSFSRSRTCWSSELLFTSEKNFELKCSVFRITFYFMLEIIIILRNSRNYEHKSPGILKKQIKWQYANKWRVLFQAVFFFHFRHQITFRRSGVVQIKNCM